MKATLQAARLISNVGNFVIESSGDFIGLLRIFFFEGNLCGNFKRLQVGFC